MKNLFKKSMNNKKSWKNYVIKLGKLKVIKKEEIKAIN